MAIIRFTSVDAVDPKGANAHHMASPRVLFVHNSPMPMRFIAMDLAMLREAFHVTELCVEGWHVNPSLTLKLVNEHDVVFAWFASRHSILPLIFAKLLGKPSALVIGGYDIARVPEADYGHQRGGLNKWGARLAIRLATRILTNANYSREEAIRNVGLDGSKIEVVHHGLDSQLYGYSECKEPMAITVANVSKNNLLRKGLEPFVRAAAQLPEVPFLVIGPWLDEAGEYLRSLAPPNATITGYLPDEDLVGYYARARVYVQASAHEGFGLANAEAMLNGCIPVVTRVGALPEVVGDAGVYIPSNSAEDIAQGVRTALTLDGERGRQARERIVREFPLDKRRQRLVEVVNELAGSRRCTVL